jgi:hypothetical protein
LPDMPADTVSGKLLNADGSRPSCPSSPTEMPEEEPVEDLIAARSIFQAEGNVECVAAIDRRIARLPLVSLCNQVSIASYPKSDTKVECSRKFVNSGSHQPPLLRSLIGVRTWGRIGGPDMGPDR